MEELKKVTLDQVKEVRAKFQNKAAGADLHPKDIERVKTDDMWIKRFICLAEMSIDGAVDSLYDCCVWRKDFGTNELTYKKIPAHLFEKGVLFIRNQDKWGKPLLIFKAKYHVKGVEDLENLKKFIVYYFESIERVSKSDQISVIFDMEETGWNNMDMDFVRYFITLLKTYYPYFVNYLMIFEMPWLLNAAWKIIKGWLPPKFVDRVKFVKKSSIQEFVDADNCLSEWGGKDSYKFKFEPEALPAPAPASPILNGSVPMRERERLGTPVSGDFEDARPGKYSYPERKSPDSSGESGPRMVDVSDKLLLSKEGSDKVGGKFYIRNVAASRETVMFKIKTTSPQKFHVRPTLGVLEWNATACITVHVVALNNLRVINLERFQVQVIPAPREVLDSVNANQQDNGEFPGDLGNLWKKFVSGESRVENHRVPCTLDSSITEAMISPTGASLVTMNEEEMRKGLAQIEQRIVEKIQAEMKQKFSKVEKALYGVVGLLMFLVFALWWAPGPTEQVCRV